MGKCLASTSYTMKADIYVPSITQDATGAVSKVWTFEKTIDCIVRSIVRTGLGDNSVSLTPEQYINYFGSMLKLRSSDVIPTNRRIVRIRNESGVIYKENQDASTGGGFENSTIFEPRGSTPLTSFDGSVIEYETMISRQEIQKLSGT
jgi:hypothetical protein